MHATRFCPFTCTLTTTTNRFDLIFLMLDPQDEQFDRRLATHLVSLYNRSRQDREESFMSMANLRDYIAFGRSYIHPQLSEEAGQALIQVGDSPYVRVWHFPVRCTGSGKIREFIFSFLGVCGHA